MTTLRQLCKRFNLQAESALVGRNPNMSEMPKGSSHWKVTLKLKGRQLTTHYSMGPAHAHEPTASEVLSCLLSDSQAGALSFKDFCSEFGYDDDSRRAERTHKACKRMAARLPTFLGDLEATFREADPE